MMRYIVSIVLLSLAFQFDALGQQFGDQLSDQEIVNVVELPILMADQDSAYLKVRGTISATCKMKGCWMTIQGPDENDIRITFKDYAFFVPKEGMEGKTVTFEGTVKRAVTDVATLRHFAQDAGKSEAEIQSIIEPKEEYSFIASGVFIED
ncbi:DUF4920 domain-containing protein [Fulvivirga lutea]|uniref:DUF4920 domain-containing protein n=1 Tax=Fulvivirga lutea TaxID=2810512 RepID=A0A974WK39_9BACT|nr:DUF4920 domain-containing protein [Fulvivirga lutea]QSE96828.1 DUF4920 domain-containing protein [Fulvivirga lutea]